MRVSKNKVTLLSLAVAGLFATAAEAVVNIDTGATAATYAKEISTLAGVSNVANALDVTGKLGFGIAINQTYFVRFDLTNATFNAVVPSGPTGFSGTPAFTGSAVVLGGQVGDSYVIIQISDSATAHLSTDTFTFATPAIKFTTTGTSVGVQYRLFQDQASAAGINGVPITNDGRKLVDKSQILINFKSAIDTTFAGARTEYEAATTNFTKFASDLVVPGSGAPGVAGQAAAATDLIAVMGTIATYGLASGVILDATGTPLANINQVLAAGSSTSTTTNFVGGFIAGAPSGYTANTFNCAAVGAGGTTTAAKVTFATSNVALTAPTSLCYQTNGTTTLVDQDISGQFNYVYNAGYAGPANTTPVVVGLWRRDGVELQSPWFTTTTGYISRFFLTNTGSVDAQCSINTWNAAGTVTPTVASVTVLAGTQLLVPATSALPTTPSGPYATRFVCAAPSSAMQGNYVLTTPNGSVAIGGMIRPGTN